jgi:ribosome maturation factor RimP
MAVVDTVTALATPLVEAHGATVYDVEQRSGKIVVSIEAPGGVDMEIISAITRGLSSALDEADPVGGAYTLEVSSPGLERRLRTLDHFAGAVGEQVTIKSQPSGDDKRRCSGVLVAAGEDHIVVRDEESGSDRRIELAAIDSAKTVFVWETTPKLGNKAKSSNRPPQSK